MVYKPFSWHPDAQVHIMWPNRHGELLAGLERARLSYGP